MNMLEVLIVNDGSKDRSLEIAHSYQDRYLNTFQVIDKPNGNYGSCVNAGLHQARGKYVKVLDADDWFDTEALGKYLTALSKLDVDLVLTRTNVVDPEGKVVSSYNQDNLFPYSQDLPFQEINKIQMFRSMSMHNVTYKTENLRTINYHQTEGISYTDQLWIHLPMSTVNTFISLDLTLYQYLVGRDGQTVNPETLKKKFAEEKQVDLEIIENCVSYKGDEAHRTYLFERMYEHQAAIYQGGVFDDRYNLLDIKDLDLQIKKIWPTVYQKLGNYYISDWRNNTCIKISQWRKPLWMLICYPIRNKINRARVKLGGLLRSF